MYTVIFHPEASKEFVESIIWYNQQKNGLGERFSLSVESIIKKIELTPEFYGYSKKPFREVTVPVFPFKIVFKINKAKKVIYVLSIFHTSRNPKNKFRKI